MEDNEEMKEMIEKVNEQVSEKICKIVDEGISGNNLDALGKLVDIHKDLANEDYWNVKKEAMEMNYREPRGYGNYGREEYPEYGRRTRDSRGRYTRRGMPGTGRYSDGDPMMELHTAYEDYIEGKKEMGRGNYGAESETMESLECMMEAIVEFVKTLKKDAESQEEAQIIQKYVRKLSEI